MPAKFRLQCWKATTQPIGSNYLQPSKPICAGPTMILDQLFDSSTCKPVPQDPSECVMIFPEARNFLIFAGDLAHGVLDSVCLDVRMTLLINWWTSKPQVRGQAHVKAMLLSDMATIVDGNCSSFRQLFVNNCCSASVFSGSVHVYSLFVMHGPGVHIRDSGL
jgi:hypothetical protein